MAQAIRLEITGLDKFARALAQHQGDTLTAAKAALYQEAQTIMTTSKVGFVPVDTGALRASGFVEPPDVTGTEISVTLGFGGVAGRGNQGETNDVNVGYALAVHEIQVYHPVGQSKYLSTPVRAAMNGMDDRLAASIRRRTP